MIPVMLLKIRLKKMELLVLVGRKIAMVMILELKNAQEKEHHQGKANFFFNEVIIVFDILFNHRLLLI